MRTATGIAALALFALFGAAAAAEPPPAGAAGAAPAATTPATETAPATAAARFTPLAHSALLAVDGARSATTLSVRIHRSADQTALTPAQLTEVAILLAGHKLPLNAQPDGSWSLPLHDLGSRTPAQVDLVVGHDGIRELLTLQLGTEAARDGGGAAAGGMSSRNKQLLWWVLNIAIVLVAAIAIARRRS